MKKAWLITWDGTSEKINDENRFVGVLSSRKSSSFVEDICDVIYSRTIFDASDSLYFANRKKERRKLCQTYEGGIIAFGHNPFLLARVVSNISITENGEYEIIKWKEPDHYGFDENHHIELKRQGSFCSLKRKRHVPLFSDIFNT